jgi:hypothetical protein
MIAMADGVRIVAVEALIVTPLQEDDQTVTRAIDAREGQHAADLRCKTVRVNVFQGLGLFAALKRR